MADEALSDAATEDRLRGFARLVRQSPHNLVSRRARGEIESRHLPECVAFAGLLPQGPATVLDVGAGGGFPGMVVAIMRPDLDVHLLDATSKKTAFLSETAAELGIGVTVHTGRGEELVRHSALRGAFDVVTARAVAPLERLVVWSVPFLRQGGLLYAIKGARWSDEVDAARVAIARAGASVVATPEDLVRPGDEPSDEVPRVVMLARVA